MNAVLARAQAFCDKHDLRLPILLAPMAGACPAALSVAVMEAGAMGACGALLMQPAEILTWCDNVRAQSDAPFQLNLWVPDPPPVRDAEQEARIRAFLRKWGPEVPPQAGDATPPDFAAQCKAILAARPAAVSSIMGVYPDRFVASAKAAGIKWFATATTVAEARAAAEAGADVIVAQGAEAGGHRGAFDADAAERQMVGTFALVPAIADAVDLPVVAAGGIADGRTVAAALMLGASAVSVGTAFLRSPEAAISPSWSEALAYADPEDTMVSRVFSGRSGRSLSTAYVKAATSPRAPRPAPYPVQRGLTAAMRVKAAKEDNLDGLQAWAGQAARLSAAEPAGEVVRRIWSEARRYLEQG